MDDIDDRLTGKTKPAKLPPGIDADETVLVSRRAAAHSPNPAYPDVEQRGVDPHQGVASLAPRPSPGCCHAPL